MLQAVGDGKEDAHLHLRSVFDHDVTSHIVFSDTVLLMPDIAVMEQHTIVQNHAFGW
jgi:hypothetical protein